MSTFETYIGIDYSGAQYPTERVKGIEVYRSGGAGEPQRIRHNHEEPSWKWCRKDLAAWLLAELRSDVPTIVGIDHAFSFPASYFQGHGIDNWDAFLDHFVDRWPTHEHAVQNYLDDGSLPVGDPKELRLTEKWTTSAKSVHRFTARGNVAYATHAGIPWLRHFRREFGGAVHFWPFDGFDVPEGKSLIVEVYPRLFLDAGVPTPAELSKDRRDAYAVCRWLLDRDADGSLAGYFHPHLSAEQRTTARIEGWILGLIENARRS